MRLTFVDDADDRYKYIVEACQPPVEYAPVFPRPVDPLSYSDWVTAAKAYKGELIIVLDLDLGLSDEDLPKKCAEFQIGDVEQAAIRADHGFHQWQGLLLAREAIRNEGMRPLLIAIASSAGNLEAKNRLLRTYVTECSNQAVRIISTNEAITSSIAASTCLAKVTAEYAAAFPPTVGDLHTVDWRTLRGRALALCAEKVSELERSDVHWPHHLPHGEHAYSDPSEQHTAAVEWAKRELSVQFPQVNHAPLYSWPKLGDALAVPLRAILTFESGATDLSAAVYAIHSRLSHDVRSEVDAIVGIGADVGRTTRLQHDYLWFNVIAVGRGLTKLAEGFFHLVREEGKKLLPGTTCRGEFTATFCECDAGIRIDVLQSTVYWHAPSLPDESSNFRERFQIRPVGLPAPDKAETAVAQAYEYLRCAGAEITVDGNGRLRAEILAETIDLPCRSGQAWIVRSGAPNES